MNAVHRGVLAVSGGRLGWHVGGMAVLELTTLGRRSGRPRTVMLTSPVQQGDAIVVVASRGGDDRNPGWYCNLCEHPEVTVAFAGSPPRAMRARIATGAERAALWPQITSTFRGYATYQDKTQRTIPVVFLEPPEPSTG